MTDRGLPRALWLALTLMVMPLLLVMGLEAYQVLGRTPALRRSGDLVVHAFEVITTAQALDRAVQDADRGQRGYLLTGDPLYLEPYRSGAQRAPILLARLKALTAANPEQRRRMPALEHQVTIKLAQLGRTLDVRESEGPEAARHIVQTNAGLDAMEAIAGQVESTIAAENALLSERLAQLAGEERDTATVALASGALAFVIMVVGVFLAVSILRSARAQQQALEDTRAALAQSQKMEALGQLTGGIAHDFNNLLHVIRNCVGLLQRRLPALDPTEASRFLDMIDRNANLAANLTQQLLAFARRQPLAPKPIDLNRLLQEMAELLRRALGEHIALETAFAPDLWTVLADASQLQTAILNLVVNARDAMPGGGRLTIETANTTLDEAYAKVHPDVSPGDYALISVRDCGTGMTKEVIARAFEPFFTTKEIGRGTGLGLSQVYGFIRQSGGHIEIFSEPGRGTTIRIQLKRLATAQFTDARMAALPVARSVAGESVLVVEDEDDVRAFTAELLVDLGYRVQRAADARTALAILEENPAIDLLFTDIGLPRVNGRALAEEVQRRWPGIKVLFTTGYAHSTIARHGRLDPQIELIAKPFTASALAQRLRTVLDRTHGSAS